jgi:hypothetical protein
MVQLMDCFIMAINSWLKALASNIKLVLIPLNIE